MDSLLSTVENLSSMFHDRMNKFEAELQNTTSPPSNVAGLAGEFATFRSFILDVVKSIQQQVESLVRSMDHIEMQGRRKILLIHGVGEKKNEDLAEVVVNIVQTQLKVENFSKADLKRCHRMGRLLNPNRHRPILVKLQQLSTREKMWFSKTKLKGSGITLSEFLTKSRHDLFLRAREMFGVSKCWIREGSIFVHGANGERHKINSRDDILKLAPVLSEGSTSAEPTSRKTESSKSRRTASKK